MVLEFVKSQQGSPNWSMKTIVLPITRKGWIKNVEMRQKTVQSHCNDVRRQHFYNNRALARTRYETFGATEGFGKDEREEAANSNEQPRKIVQDTTATITRECPPALLKYKSLDRSNQGKRGWGNKRMKLKKFKDVTIPSELQLTLRGDIFYVRLLFWGWERFPIFSTEQNLNLLESSPQWHGNGTVKCCPTLFYQLYTVHGVLNGHTIPLVYMLFKRKTLELYLRALNELKKINQCFQLCQITIDFEIVCLLAECSGCFCRLLLPLCPSQLAQSTRP